MGSMTFNEMWLGYEKLLNSQPGKALELEDHHIAVLIGDEVCIAQLSDDNKHVLDCGSFDPRSWVGDEEAERVISNPVFVGIDHLDFSAFK